METGWGRMRGRGKDRGKKGAKREQQYRRMRESEEGENRGKRILMKELIMQE
jgi:hypothetical protein